MWIYHTQKVGKYFKMLTRTLNFWISDSPKIKNKNYFYKSPHILSIIQSFQNIVLVVRLSIIQFLQDRLMPVSLSQDSVMPDTYMMEEKHFLNEAASLL